MEGGIDAATCLPQREDGAPHRQEAERHAATHTQGILPTSSSHH